MTKSPVLDHYDVGGLIETARRGVVSPENKMLAAVLRVALEDYLRLRVKDGTSFRRLGTRVEETLSIEYTRLRRWIFTDEEQQQDANGYTFLFICDAIGLNPEWLRDQLIKRPEELEIRRYKVA